jgi:hypothetical protein
MIDFSSQSGPRIHIHAGERTPAAGIVYQGPRERPTKGGAPTGIGGAPNCRVFIVFRARAYSQAPRQRRASQPS